MEPAQSSARHVQAMREELSEIIGLRDGRPSALATVDVTGGVGDAGHNWGTRRSGFSMGGAAIDKGRGETLRRPGRSARQFCGRELASRLRLFLGCYRPVRLSKADLETEQTAPGWTLTAETGRKGRPRESTQDKKSFFRK